MAVDQKCHQIKQQKIGYNNYTRQKSFNWRYNIINTSLHKTTCNMKTTKADLIQVHVVQNGH